MLDELQAALAVRRAQSDVADTVDETGAPCAHHSSAATIHGEELRAVAAMRAAARTAPATPSCSSTPTNVARASTSTCVSTSASVTGAGDKSNRMECEKSSLAEPSPKAVAFAAFLAASETLEVQQAFYTLLAECCGTPTPTWPTLAQLCKPLLPIVPHRSKQLLHALQARAAAPQYEKSGAVVAPGGLVKMAHAVIIGAGPVGLRCAIELALLGARVDVLEQRTCFSRLQILHLWEWVEHDLVELGIKYIDPSIFTSGDLRRCATAQLQHSLLKVLLLLGARVRFGCQVDSVDSLALLLGSRRVDVLVDASGARCALLDGLGFYQTVALRSTRALCIVLSLVNGRTSEELQLRESTWSQQYWQAEFAALKAHGVALENLVYYRSTGAFTATPTHYFVLTTTSTALLAFRALRTLDGDPYELCEASNVDMGRVEAYARMAVGAFVPQLLAHALVPGQLSLFDFSERKQSNRAAAAVPGTALGGRQESCCLVTRVGDALQEPFWPEGLGVNRGFLGAYDCAAFVKQALPYLLIPMGQLATPIEGFDAVVRTREELYAVTKRISATNRLKELRPHVDGARRYCYTIEPASRYVSWSSAAAAPAAAAGALTSTWKPRMVFHTTAVPAARKPRKGTTAATPAARKLSLEEIDRLIQNAADLLAPADPEAAASQALLVQGGG